VVDILEEIIEYKESDKTILNYVVLAEQALRTLLDLIKIWNDPESSNAEQEHISDNKVFFIFFKAMQALEYLHS
jgi:hypothetical protein